MSETVPPPLKTPTRPIRVPTVMWDAYGRVVSRLETDRSARILEHMAADIREHGSAQDVADLEQGLRELAERRARMHQGRPRKTQG
ncbi:hypothetical protein E1287_34650 [Actinomadura sp. KC06]|uniref:hypothetical protein n=1 Tax=Actinomadura sp. KC06 TaxID=2530369 RepID=UPI0010492BD6|nr:hypothetical protein [Actinomadura sp. KC06]TDD27359.1 hypothetical protein E1287_34650 [Actinomadura sp. KC06]